MRELDNVKLKEEIEELSGKGIHKGYRGVIVRIEGDICTVCFYNPYNFGERAYVKVKKETLKYLSRSDETIVSELGEFFKTVNMERETKLTECDVKEYDIVELIADKARYRFEGLKKGMVGVVTQTYAIENRWEIIFNEAGESGDKIVQINVDREDFKVIGNTLE